MGYDFAAAVADLVDNSIEAGASLVAIDVEFDGDDSWVRIADNGKGMTPDELREAMRYGAERDYDEEDLGKFGLGLKTASMSQCKRLSVASRSNRGRADITAYCWDLDHIERTNRWEIIPLEKTGIGPAVRTPLKDTTGTVVLWQQLDRILGYKHPYGEFARKKISQMCRELEDHLGMVFHRFLKGEVKDKKLRVMLNGNEIQVWDPFCRAEHATKKLEKMRLPIEHEGTKGHVLVEPFVLPHQEDFSSPEAFRRASGPANWNQQQGFYIYRAGRMIQSGGWSRLRTPDEHTKLARIGLSFSPALDEAFKINVAKMRVQLPTSVRDEIARVIIPVVKLAREAYDRKPRSKPGSGSRGKVSEEMRVPGSGSSRLDASGKGGETRDRGLLTFNQVADLLREVATDAEQSVVESIIHRLRKALRGAR
jgi:histidine kinase/DNA gyrase B/HSP90-like ATPase